MQRCSKMHCPFSVSQYFLFLEISFFVTFSMMLLVKSSLGVYKMCPFKNGAIIFHMNFPMVLSFSLMLSSSHEFMSWSSLNVFADSVVSKSMPICNIGILNPIWGGVGIGKFHICHMCVKPLVTYGKFHFTPVMALPLMGENPIPTSPKKRISSYLLVVNQ